MSPDRELEDSAHAACRVGMLRLEGAEVVRADQRLCRRVHRLLVEREMVFVSIVPQERVQGSVVIDHVAISFPFGGPRRMKGDGHLVCVGSGLVVGKKGLQSGDESFAGDGRLGLEAGNLTQRVHAGVGAACGNDGRRVPVNCRMPSSTTACTDSPWVRSASPRVGCRRTPVSGGCYACMPSFPLHRPVARAPYHPRTVTGRRHGIRHAEDIHDVGPDLLASGSELVERHLGKPAMFRLAICDELADGFVCCAFGTPRRMRYSIKAVASRNPSSSRAAIRCGWSSACRTISPQTGPQRTSQNTFSPLPP